MAVSGTISTPLQIAPPSRSRFLTSSYDSSRSGRFKTIEPIRFRNPLSRARLKSVAARRDRSSNIRDLDQTIRVNVHNSSGLLPGVVAHEMRLAVMYVSVEHIARPGPAHQPVDGLEALVCPLVFVVNAVRRRVCD